MRGEVLTAQEGIGYAKEHIEEMAILDERVKNHGVKALDPDIIADICYVRITQASVVYRFTDVDVDDLKYVVAPAIRSLRTQYSIQGLILLDMQGKGYGAEHGEIFDSLIANGRMDCYRHDGKPQIMLFIMDDEASRKDDRFLMASHVDGERRGG